MSLPIGSQQRTSDGVIGTSGKKIRVYGIRLRSGGGGAAAVSLYNNTSATGTPLDIVNGTTSLTVSVSYPGGLLFPSGCFVDVDTNTDWITVIYEQENS